MTTTLKPQIVTDNDDDDDDNDDVDDDGNDGDGRWRRQIRHRWRLKLWWTIENIDEVSPKDTRINKTT